VSVFRTSNGEVVTGERLQAARDKTAETWDALGDAALIGKIPFASHVTDAEIARYAKSQYDCAKAIRSGLQDGNFTIWQRINTILTGECVPFLPPVKAPPV